MLHLIKDFADQFFGFLAEDPVRPNIPVEKRIGDNKEIFVLHDENNALSAITCVSYQNSVPLTEKDLFEACEQATVAVFYTIWSYKPGAGRQLIFDTADYIKEHCPNISRLVTLSPKTEMAHKFHIKNGAFVFRENIETINYEYRRI